MRHHIHLYFPSMVLLVLAALAMAIQGTWGIDIAHNWIFIAIMVIMAVVSFWQSCRHRHNGNKASNWFNHVGFALLIVTAVAGAPWNEQGKAIVTSDKSARIFYSTDGSPLAMPFEMQLAKFDITYYKDNEHIQQYAALLRVQDLTYSDTTVHVITTAVNQPATYLDYQLYLDSYDTKNQQYVVIKIVKEPLMPLIYIALALLAIGALLQIPAHWQSQAKWLWITTAILVVVFSLISLARIHLGHLMPALRSWWFVPHLACYMIAYAMLALAIVMAIVKKLRPDPEHKLSNTISFLLHTSSSLMLLGMVCGAVWAKQAWGDYWTWDPKECWAAATWFLSLAATHSTRAKGSSTRANTRFIMMILCFLAMQITWYGVNYLPSAKDSLHTYNTK